MNLALSTSWNAYRFNNGAELLFEIDQLKFKAVELSFNLTSEVVDGIVKESRRLGIKIQSLHNYCPIPAGLTPKQALPDCYSLASLDNQERLLAVKYTKSTIDTASNLGAKVVVLHCGRVQIPDSTRQLINLYNQAPREQAAFIKLKDEMIRLRSGQAPAFFEQVLSSLDELNAYAKIKHVFLGVETRFYYCEIPAIFEIGAILDKFRNSQIFYWHDTGHAQVMENLGFAKHKDFLELYGRNLIGVHLHDVAGCQDHLAPAKGGLDFSLLKPYLTPDTLKVIEAHAPATAQDLIKSRDYISRIYDESD
ncbi:MAG TPA: sugar phosphate isomerase/epimerase [Candidatus Omnitrophota bacterium]|nr:sugar phosphate isomerase/epimerase [Candidatus Omnitrophota bacterium]HPT39316.1 sugar phosphate isomerase/epimerase [Candidatus Omnitrophota bacterium]